MSRDISSVGFRSFSENGLSESKRNSYCSRDPTGEVVPF